MGITAIKRDFGANVCIVRINTTDDLATVGTAGYLLDQKLNIEIANDGEFTWVDSDFVLVYASDGWGQFTIDPNFITLNAFGGGGGSGIQTLTGNTGGAISPSGGNINIVGSIAASGSSVTFAGASDTLTFRVTDANTNTVIGAESGSVLFSANNQYSVVLGSQNLTDPSPISVARSSAIGNFNLRSLQNGRSDFAWGFNNLSSLTAGDFNSALGESVAINLLTGSKNLFWATSDSVGVTYTGAESNNIIIGGSQGIVGDNGVSRFGYVVDGSPSQTACYIDGITAVDSSSIASPVPVFIDSATGQLAKGPVSTSLWTPGFVRGFAYSRSAAVITLGSGKCLDSADTFEMISSGSLTLDITNNGAGGLDTGSPANNTWYAIYLIENSSTSAVALIASTSFSAPSLPGGYDKYRYLRSILTGITAAILDVAVSGNENRITYLWTQNSLAAINNGMSTTAASINLSVGISPVSNEVLDMNYNYNPGTTVGNWYLYSDISLGFSKVFSPGIANAVAPNVWGSTGTLIVNPGKTAGYSIDASTLSNISLFISGYVEYI